MVAVSTHLNPQIDSSATVRVYIMERVCLVSREANALLRLVKPNSRREGSLPSKFEVNATWHAVRVNC